jgi:hypothetical protein
MTAQYDPSNDEIIALWVECGQDPVRFYRVAVAQATAPYYLKTPGIIRNTDDGHYVVMD